MSGPDKEKLGVKLHARPSLDTNSAIPIKKRRLIFFRSPSPPSSPPPGTHSSVTVDSDKIQNISLSLVDVPSLEASDSPNFLTTSSDEGSSRESGCKNLVTGEISEACKHQVPIEHECNEKLQSIASIDVEGENGLKDTVSDDKLVSFEGIGHHSAFVGHASVQMEEEIVDAKNYSNPTLAGLSENIVPCKETLEKVHINDSRSFRQGHLEMQDPSSRKGKYVQDPQKKCFTSRSNVDSGQSCLDRFKWDLNTTMDTWDESMNDLALNHGSDEHGRSGFVGLVGRGQEPNLMGASVTNKNLNALAPLSNELKSLSSDHFLSLCVSPKSVGVGCNSKTEACVDLHLKPSLMSESHFTRGTLGNVDSRNETQFLSLSTAPSPSSADPKFSVCGAVKIEPYHGCTQLEERKSQIAGPEVFSLKPIKSEPCEIGDASKITISGVFNSDYDAAIKLEPVLDKSQVSVAAKETGLPHISSDHDFLHNSRTPLEVIGTDIMASNTKSDSLIRDVNMQKPGEYSHLHKYEVDSMALVMQNEVLSDGKMSAVTSISQSEKGIFGGLERLVMQPLLGRELVSIKQASNEGSEQTDISNKSKVKGLIMTFDSLIECEACEQPRMAAESLCESFNSGTLVERVVDEKGKFDSHMSSSEIDSKIATVVETNAISDVLEFNQAINQSICMMEQDENECMTGSPHVTDRVIRAVLEEVGIDDHGYEVGEVKDRALVLEEVGIDDHGYEVGEVKDRALLGANGDSHLRVEIKKTDSACPRDIADVPVAMPSSHEDVKHSLIESSEMSKDPGTVECANNIDPAIAADLQESSSVTGDSKDSLKKDNVSEWKAKSERDSTLTVVSNENTADGSSMIKNAGGLAKFSAPYEANESIKDAFDRGRTGRIINLNSALSRKMINERPLSSRVERENPADNKLFKREKSDSRHSRDENPYEKYRKTENVKRRGLAFVNHGSGSMCARVSGGSNYSHFRFRDKQAPNQFNDRNCDPNYAPGQINDHNDFRYSRAINSAEVSMASGTDNSVPCASRISRKVTNELRSRAHMPCRRHSPGGPEQMPVMRHPTSEVNPSRSVQRDAPDLVYASQEKMNRPVSGEMLDPLRGHPLSQFERSDRIPAARRERLSLSPVHRRGPPQLNPPMCSPRSQAMSPSHWPQRSNSEGFNGQPEMVQCRTGTPMQESMRSSRQHYAEEMLARRRFGARLPDDMMEVMSSREHDFPRSGRDFPRQIQRLDMNDPRQVPGEYYRTPFGHEPAVDGEEFGRRCNDMHVPARYRQHCIAGDDVENFAFHGEEGPPRSYRYHAEGNQGFNEGGNSREFEGRFKNRLGNASRRYRHIEEQQHEDGFRHEEGQGWNNSGFNNIRPKRRRY